MRPTVKDLARAAGVSLATVDRVLNERPNVSKQAALKVREAIKRINFVRNMAAVNLARNTSYRFRFLLPETGDQFLREIMTEISATNAAMRSDLMSADIMQVAIEDPHVVANALRTLDESTIDGVAIMAPESPEVRDAIGRLSQRGIHVVQFLSGQQPQDGVDAVGINNRAAGATAARLIGRFSVTRSGKIMVLAETMRARDSIERRHGFDAVINASFQGLEVLPSLETHADPQRTNQIIANTVRHHRVVAVYVMSAEARTPLATIGMQLDLDDVTVVAHERTPYTVAGLNSGGIDAIIAQNPGHAVRSAVRLMRARADNREPVTAQERIRIEILLRDNL